VTRQLKSVNKPSPARQDLVVGALRLETVDLVLTEAEEDDLDAIVAVRRSNADRLARTEGTDAGPGDYDRGMLERDLAVAAYDPVRRFLCARLRHGGRIVGYVDVLDAHPEDGVAWLGVVEISASDHRQGYGRQCVEALARRAEEDLCQSVLRAAADSDDRTAASFLEQLGFTVASRTERSSPRGRVPVTVFERRLRARC
jgi:ribosomal protein S18 acetylase RimI-like enzyme